MKSRFVKGREVREKTYRELRSLLLNPLPGGGEILPSLGTSSYLKRFNTQTVRIVCAMLGRGCTRYEATPKIPGEHRFDQG